MLFTINMEKILNHWTIILSEFYFYIVYYNPKVLEEGKSLKEKYDNIKWKNNPKFIQAWKEGKTGYPAVDAAMRQINTEGYTV